MGRVQLKGNTERLPLPLGFLTALHSRCYCSAAQGGADRRGVDDGNRRPASVKASLSVAMGQRAPNRSGAREEGRGKDPSVGGRTAAAAAATAVGRDREAATAPPASAAARRVTSRSRSPPARRDYDERDRGSGRDRDRAYDRDRDRAYDRCVCVCVYVYGGDGEGTRYQVLAGGMGVLPVIPTSNRHKGCRVFLVGHHAKSTVHTSATLV